MAHWVREIENVLKSSGVLDRLRCKKKEMTLRMKLAVHPSPTQQSQSKLRQLISRSMSRTQWFTYPARELEVTNSMSRLNVTNSMSHLNVTDSMSRLNVTNSVTHLSSTAASCAFSLAPSNPLQPTAHCNVLQRTATTVTQLSSTAASCAFA